jgi:integrase
MPKLSENTVPSYRLHRQSGQAVVTFCGRDILLGHHGSAASKAEYRRRVAEWFANNRQSIQEEADFSIAELIAAFKAHAEKYYRRPDGTETDEVKSFRRALRPLRELYGSKLAREFGPLALETVRSRMIQLGWCRTSINHNVARIKHVFKWAVSRELVPASIHHAIITLSGLRAGRSEAIESLPVEPVPDHVVDATVRHLSSVVATMVRLQRLTGARPGEICQMITADIDTTGPVWIYKPAAHKTAHHGHQRSIFIGPKAQEVLRPFLKTLNPQAYIFSPMDADAENRGELQAGRKTPLSCGNRPGSNRKRRPKRAPGDRYDATAYRRAIRRATESAFPPPEQFARQKVKGRKGKKSKRWETPVEWCQRLGPEKWKELQDWRREHSWHPHQLRHTAATEIRRRFGIEAAQHVLGHATLSITELYAEKNADVANRIAAAIG